jgi:hypothetical protein
VDQFGNPLPTPVQTPSGAPGAPVSGAAPGTPVGQGMGGTTVGGGLAGVASKFEQTGIKSYNDTNKYNEWEFVYDMTKDPARSLGGVPQATGQPGAQPGTPVGTPAGTPAGAPPGVLPGSAPGMPPAATPGTN